MPDCTSLQTALRSPAGSVLREQGADRCWEQTGFLSPGVPGTARCLAARRPEALGSWAGRSHVGHCWGQERPGCGTQTHCAPASCWQVENLKEKLISQAQEVSRLRSELVSLPVHSWKGGCCPATLDPSTQGWCSPSLESLIPTEQMPPCLNT